MIYQETLTTRWHDTDATLSVRPSQILVYMQEMAFHHLDAAGKNPDDMRYRDGLAFLLIRLTLNFYQPLHASQSITAQTWICEGKGVNFPRCFRLLAADGTIAAEGASSWALLNLHTHLPVRVEDFAYGFTAEPPLSFSTPRRFELPDRMVEVGTRRIAYSDIDYNGHMNNTRYPDMVCDFLPEGTVPRIRTMNMEFAHEAKLGTTLRILRGEHPTKTGKAYLIQTFDENDRLCLAAETLTE